MQYFCLYVIFFITFNFLNVSAAYSGVLVSASASWSIFSFRAEEENQSAPNYYGIGPSLLFGYSIGKIFDLALFTDYTPGNQDDFQIGQEYVSLFYYGGHVAIRGDDKILLGLKFGQARCHFVKQSVADEIVPAIWEGPSASVLFGAIYKEDRKNYWQLSLEIMHTLAEKIPSKDQSTRKRRLDAFKITATYTFYAFLNRRLNNNILKGFF